jgi:hypothetical protein
MGKYDTFRCDFPIPDGLLFGESQQGDVESEFDEYRITADGGIHQTAKDNTSTSLAK